MGYLSDLFHLTRVSKYVLLGGALLIALCAGALLWFAPRYDNPANSPHEENRDIVLLGHAGTLAIDCDCPAYLIAQRPRHLTFHIKVAIQKEAKPGVVHASLKPNETIEFLAEAKAAGIDDQWELISSATGLISTEEASRSISLELRPSTADFSEVSFTLMDYLENESVVESVAHINWALPTRPPLRQTLQPALYAFLIFLVALVSLYTVDRKYRLLREEEEQRLAAARARVEQNPTKVSPAWELAGANLQNYFTRNLAQVRQVFYVAVGVMLIGFAFVLYGVYVQITSAQLAPKNITPATWVASISGIITQFIGATFMVIYRSTMAQANEFVTILDRINTAGIALKVLDQIPDTDARKSSAREQLISLLLGSRPKPAVTLQAESKKPLRAQPDAVLRSDDSAAS